MGRFYLFAGLMASLLWVGCSNNDNKEAVGERQLRLTKFMSCGELETHLKQSARNQVERQTAQLLRYDFNAVNRVGIAANSEAGGAADLQAPTAAPERDRSHSTTNTQEEGVDEGDLIKTDGKYIYAIVDRKLYIVEVSEGPTQKMTLMSKTDLGGYGHELYIEGNQVVTVATLNGDEVPVPLQRKNQDDGTYAGKADIAVDCDGSCGPSWNSVLQVALWGVQNGKPELKHTWTAQADYMTSRRVGNSVHFVVRGAALGPSIRSWPEFEGTSNNGFRAAVRLMRQDNLRAIEQATWEDWMPRSIEVKHDGSAPAPDATAMARCEDFYHTDIEDGVIPMDIATLRLDKPFDAFNHTGVFGHGGVVYGSTQSLYLATHPWFTGEGWWGWWDSDVREKERSKIFKFDIATDPSHAIPRGKGIFVDGHVLNQFAMDEVDGHLRVATTVSIPPRFATLVEGPVSSASRDTVVSSGPENDNDDDDAAKVNCDSGKGQNHLFTIREGNDPQSNEVALVQVGEYRGFGCPNETIQSVRYVDNRAYVVTFERKDPLFVFDMSNPEAITKMGERGDISGFSTYMHPIRRGDKLFLLTIGQDADSQGIVRGVKISLFDVTNGAEPKVVHEAPVSGNWSSSEALYEHKAFSYFPADPAHGRPKDLLAVPMESYNNDFWYDSSVGLRVYEIDPEAAAAQTIVAKAEIQHNDTKCYPQDPQSEYVKYRWQVRVRRSLFIDSYLYSFSDMALLANSFSNLSATSDLLCFDPPSWFDGR